VRDDKQIREQVPIAMPRFRQKLKGPATRRMFAAACESYLDDAMNDTDLECSAIFRYLSPQQRVRLVREVMIGMLCDDEPLPPDTLEHASAYRALIDVLASQIDCEYDVARDCETLKGELLLSDRDRGNRRFTNERERIEYVTKYNLAELRGRSVKRKLEKGLLPEIIDEEAQMSPPPPRLSAKMVEDCTELFEGGRSSVAVRNRLRNVLTEDEKLSFYHRIFVDDAAQEHGIISPLLPPLSHANIDFRSCSTTKWRQLIELMLYTATGNGQGLTLMEEKLLTLKIDFKTYARPSALGLVQAFRKLITRLRSEFKESWDENSVGDDQRCIFAVCCGQLYGRKEQQPWVEEINERAKSLGICLTQRGNYQQRYELCKAMKSSHLGEHMKGFFYDNFRTWSPPTEHDDIFDGTAKGCHNVCWGGTRREVKLCSGCGVVYYCSKKCQLEDRRSHRSICKVLAMIAKDKEKVDLILENFDKDELAWKS